MKKKDVPKLIIILIAIVAVAGTSIIMLNNKQEKAKRNVTKESSNLEIGRRKNIIDQDKNGKISIGDEIILENEHFYVISTNEETNTVKMIAKYNLNIGNLSINDQDNIQNEECTGYINKKNNNCSITFSELNYWNDKEEYVYKDEANAYTYLNKYVSILSRNGHSIISSSLISKEELTKLGCKIENNSINCTESYNWLYNTNYWLGNNANKTDIYVMKTTGISENIKYKEEKAGIKPVITISAAEI